MHLKTFSFQSLNESKSQAEWQRIGKWGSLPTGPTSFSETELIAGPTQTNEEDTKPLPWQIFCFGRINLMLLEVWLFCSFCFLIFFGGEGWWWSLTVQHLIFKAFLIWLMLKSFFNLTLKKIKTFLQALTGMGERLRRQTGNSCFSNFPPCILVTTAFVYSNLTECS